MKTEAERLHGRDQQSTTERIKNGVADYIRHLKLFSRNTRLYLTGSFLMGVNFNVFQLLLNLYLKEYGFSETEIGYVLSSRAVGMILIAIPAAMLLSRVRIKPVLLTASILFAIFSFFITTVQMLVFLMGFSLLSGMAFTFYRVGAAPFYMRNSTPEERTYVFSLNFGMMLLSGMAGSVGSGKLVTVIGDVTGDIILGYQYTLYGGIVVGLLSLIPFLKIKASDPSPEEDKITLSVSQFRERGGFYFKIAFSNFLVGMGAGLTVPFLNLYFRDRFGLQPDTIGVYYFVVQFAMLGGTMAAPLLVKKFGLVRAVVITQLASMPFMLILSYTYFLPLAFIAFVFRGGLMNIGSPLVTNFGMELSEKNEQGVVNAALMIAWTSSWMVSSAIGGRLIELYGYTVTINVTVVLYIVSTLTFFMFFRRTERKTETSSRWTIARENV